MSCYCGKSLPYSGCCEPFHLQVASPETAEQLMRSRYSAYLLQKIDYLVQTHHPRQRRANAFQEIQNWAQAAQFTRLEVLKTHQGQATDKIGKVEFIAHYQLAGQPQTLHEISRFRRFEGKWVYWDGLIREGR